MKTKNQIIIKLVLAFFLVFVSGFYIGQSRPFSFIRNNVPENVDFSLFWEAWENIEGKYVDEEKVNSERLIQGAISGMVESLEDPHTIFLTPEEARRFLEDVKGSFEGVGIEIAIKDGQLQVIAPLEGTPAQEAGLRPGDEITKVDGRSVANIPADIVTDWIRGAKGTEVILTIYRKDWGKEKEIKMTRRIIDIPSLNLEMLTKDNSSLRGEESVAYLKLYHFSEKANQDFKEAAVNILNSSAQKIILDLRNNPGGYLNVVQDIAGWFLEPGRVVAIEDFTREEEEELVLARGNNRLLNYPIVVLINEGSASASEILAGALRDNRQIQLIGKTSFGKGSVQELTRLRGGFYLKITVAKWLTPKRNSITDQGLEPDIEINMTEEDFEKGRDPQLEKAIELIKDL